MTEQALRDPYLTSRPMSRETWLLRTLILQSSRIYDAAERQAWCDRYWAEHPRLEAQQWRKKP